MLKKTPNTAATVNTCPAKSQPNGTNGTNGTNGSLNGATNGTNGKVNGHSGSKANGVDAKNTNGHTKIDTVKVDTSKAQKKFSQVDNIY